MTHSDGSASLSANPYGQEHRYDYGGEQPQYDDEIEESEEDYMDERSDRYYFLAF